MSERIRAGFLGALLLLVSVAAEASTITIDFGPLAGANAASYSGHVEDGFTISAEAGSWFEAHVFGNPVPSIFAGPIGAPSLSEIGVSDGLFNFLSVDLSSNTSAGSDYTILGFLNNVPVFSQAGFINNVDTFNTIASNNPTLVIDFLRIGIAPGRATTSMNLDNIVLDNAPAAVPERTATMLLLGIGMFTLLLQRSLLPRSIRGR